MVNFFLRLNVHIASAHLFLMAMPVSRITFFFTKNRIVVCAECLIVTIIR